MKRILILVAWVVVATVALYLRLHNLGENPLHFDEATGASLLGQTLSGDNPGFDPTHFHGPWLRLSSIPIAKLRGEIDWQSLSSETLRLSTAIAGWLLCFTPLLWTSFLCTKTKLASAALLATSPLAVYYSRMYIHETWLALFGMLACAAFYRFCKNPNHNNALFAGFGIGMMFATKETFFISVSTWALASLLLFLSRTSKGLQPKPWVLPKSLISMFIWAVFISGLFYTDIFNKPSGYIDALRTFFLYETTSGHSKDFNYYFQLLIVPKQAIGQYWSEGLIAILALTTLPYLVRRRVTINPVQFVALAAISQFLIYSCISYKTPWLILLTWAQICLWAGLIFQYFSQYKKAIKLIILLLFTSTLGWQFQQSIVATGNYANDARNPYAYVPTSQDLEKLPHWLENLTTISELQPVAVVGSSYWPLPWYLRNIEVVGYWQKMRSDFVDFPLIFVMPENIQDSDKILANTHKRLPRGLRENVALMMYLRNDIWEKWIGEHAQ